jgi:hypothetical protein
MENAKTMIKVILAANRSIPIFLQTELFTGFHTPPNWSIRAAINCRGGRVRPANMKLIILKISLLLKQVMCDSVTRMP